MAESASAASTNRADLSQVTGLYHETLELLAGMADARCPHNDGHSSQVRTFAGQLARAARPARDGAATAWRTALCCMTSARSESPTCCCGSPGPLSREETLIVDRSSAARREDAPARATPGGLDPDRPQPSRADSTAAATRTGSRARRIALGARIVALADVFDALISHRVYRPAMTPASARQLIAEKAGSQFDPDLAAVFLSLQLEDLIEH